jgi:predicted nucleotidyltransferase
MVTQYHSIAVDRELLASFCRRHNVRRSSLFGSILRPDFQPASDIDILVEFDEGQTPSLMDLGGMQVELTEMFGREVDLKTPGFLSQRIRQSVMSEAVVQYAA